MRVNQGLEGHVAIMKEVFRSFTYIKEVILQCITLLHVKLHFNTTIFLNELKFLKYYLENVPFVLKTTFRANKIFESVKKKICSVTRIKFCIN